MKIFIYVPGMGFDGNTIDSDVSLGGSETMGYYLCRELEKLGHSVFCFCNVPAKQVVKINNVTYIPVGEPSRQFPFGNIFMQDAMNIPHDVLIAQRAPGIFGYKFNAKLNIWWSHDLALHRNSQAIQAMMWNTDKILGVSKFHVNQIKKIYGIDEKFIDFIPNGIDLELYKIPSKLTDNAVISFDEGLIERKIASKVMLYSNRPERGLINLVNPGGIMEKLLQLDPELKLHVCNYEHTTEQMAPLYNFLYQRCNELPNVKVIGHLSKRQLAVEQQNSWIHIYPTEFEEVSCLTAMEQQAAGTPFMTTRTAALPETLKDAGVYYSKLNNFDSGVKFLLNNPNKWKQLHQKALQKANEYSIANTAIKLEKIIEDTFKERTNDLNRLYKHFIYHSDYVAAEYLVENHDKNNEIIEPSEDKPKPSSKFYEDIAQYNIDIGNTHSIDKPDVILQWTRLQPVIEQLSKLPDGSTVLEYGSCVGQVTFALQKAFPDLKFTGVEISQKQVDIANKHALSNKIPIAFYQVSKPSDIRNLQINEEYDCIICLEVLEHVGEPVQFLEDLEKFSKPDGKMIISTPCGPGEADRPESEHPIEHMHHFEEADILDMIGHKKDRDVVYCKSNDNTKAEKFGSFVWYWTTESSVETTHNVSIKHINYDRKIAMQNPRETVSACLIVGADSDCLQKTLKSIQGFADEIIVGIDDPELGCDEKPIYGILERFGANWFQINSPLDPDGDGFAGVRNETLKHATGDWIFWIDDDEVLIWPERLQKFIRRNQFDSYAVAQHHISAEPAGVLKTDRPCRLFRNNGKIKFWGYVHEHPETEINKGSGKPFILPDMEGCIMHNGYETELVRRTRFMRNWPLMLKDREAYPDRYLGQFLWIRDLAHVNRFEFEQTGQKTQIMLDRCKEGIAIWRELLDKKMTRLVKESLMYLSELVDLLTEGGGYQFNMTLNLAQKGMGDKFDQFNRTDPTPHFMGKVETKKDLENLSRLLIDEKTNLFEESGVYL
jgi:2-polyprenyl-3-methyl-5-hydroxy-6-metoxy-1,4-benzoquinol methylase/glycosyltransferase involved in cell wall biosynthesis